MASSLLALLDDIALLTKLAAKKTAGVLGDDLALNAQQVAGVQPDRELPVVWAVAKGSARNKLILVPAALALSVWMPWAVVPLLMVGGLFLCYEGFEKIAHKLLHSKQEDAQHEAELIEHVVDPLVDMVVVEKDKIKGAVRTDFILSAEIIAITLGTVALSPIGTRLAVLAGIAVIMTVGVYGLVAGIVKLDDAGLYLSQKTHAGLRRSGEAILWAAPWLMKALSVLGTAAMFLVGGGILTHGVHDVHAWIEQSAANAASLPAVGSIVSALTQTVINGLVGVLSGALVVGVVALVQRLRQKKA